MTPFQNNRRQIDSRDIAKGALAIILAGGRGSRLQGLTDWRAKPAVPFGGKFRVIDFALSNCLNSGIRRVGVATQYKAHSLIQHLQRGWGFLRGELGEFIEILPAQQRLDDESWYKGTADAVTQNLDILDSHRPEWVLVLAGDHVYKMDYAKLLLRHAQSGADITIACMEAPLAEASAFGVMSAGPDGRITSFAEKPLFPDPIPGREDRALVSMGIYAFRSDLLRRALLEDAADPASSHDFGKDIIPKLVAAGNAFASPFSESCVGSCGSEPYWRDVGTVDSYWSSNLDLASITPALNLYDEQWPIWTYQAQLPPAKFVFDYDGRQGHALDSLISGGCVLSAALARGSVLFSNVRADDCLIESSVLLPNVRVGPGSSIRRAVIDQGCVLPDGFHVGIDPESDRERFFVTESGIALVTPSMLGQRPSSV